MWLSEIDACSSLWLNDSLTVDHLVETAIELQLTGSRDVQTECGLECLSSTCWTRISPRMDHVRRIAIAQRLRFDTVAHDSGRQASTMICHNNGDRHIGYRRARCERRKLHPWQLPSRARASPDRLIARRQIDRVIASQSEKGSLPEGYSGTGGWRQPG